MVDVAIFFLNTMTKENKKLILQRVLPFLQANRIEPIVISRLPQSTFKSIGEAIGYENIYSNLTDEGINEVIRTISNENRVVLQLGDCCSQFQGTSFCDLQDEPERIIEKMANCLFGVDSDRYEIIAGVDMGGNLTGIGLNRNGFYNGIYTNVNDCGVVWWIFDKEGNVLLSERGNDKEQGKGKISPPSGHVQLYDRVYPQACILENPIVACLLEVGEEHGIHYEKKNFTMLDDCFPIGVIRRPGNSGKGCNMIVKHFALCIDDETRKKIQNNESSNLFWLPYQEVRKIYMQPDSAQQNYIFFGNNKSNVLNSLGRFRNKIRCLPELGPEASWRTISAQSFESEENFGYLGRKEIPEGYSSYAISTDVDLITIPDHRLLESYTFRTFGGAIPAAEDYIVALSDIPESRLKQILEDHGLRVKDVARQIIYRHTHTGKEFGQVPVPTVVTYGWTRRLTRDGWLTQPLPQNFGR